MEPLLRRVDELTPLTFDASLREKVRRAYQSELEDIVALYMKLADLNKAADPTPMLRPWHLPNGVETGTHYISVGRWYASFEVDHASQTVRGLDISTS